jgi:hypothetical protein
LKRVLMFLHTGQISSVIDYCFWALRLRHIVLQGLVLR